MADFNRDIGEVSPTNYVNPGVQKPSPLSLAAELGSQAINLDTELAKKKLREEAESLRTAYEVGSPAAIAVQESDAPPLSEGDQKQVNAVGKELSTIQKAVDQGRMTFDSYRVRGERLLRLAISKRPGLATEFRQVAAQYLGTDVVGASVDVLANAERAMAKKEGKEDGPDFKRMRDHLDKVGVPSGLLTDEQVSVEYARNLDAVQQILRQQAENEVATTAASTQQAGQVLRRPTATATFVSEVQAAKLDVYRSFNTASAAIKTGQLTPDQLTTVINNGSAQLSGRISTLRQSMAQGDVDVAIAEKEIAGLEELGRQMTELASGKLGNDVLKNKIDGTLLYMQNAMLDNENVAVLAGATRVFGPEIMTTFVGPGGSFNKQAAIALGDTLTNTGTPITRASNAGSVASSVIASVLDRGGAKTNPQSVPAMGTTLINGGKAFVEVNPKDFRSDYLTGPNGYITVLHRQREGLAKALGLEQKQELAQSVALAASANRLALVSAFGKKFPSLVDKVVFQYNTATGDIIQPKGTLTATEQSAIRQYNQAFAGKNVAQTIKALTETDDYTVGQMIGSGTSFISDERKRRPAPAATGGNWWEQL